MAPFPIQVTARFGSRSFDHGAAGWRGSNGSLRSVMKSGNSFSPSSVPPPFLLRNVRPSSVARALNGPPPNLPPPAPRAPPPPPPPPPMMSRTISTAAVGSNTTVYLLGSSHLGLSHCMSFFHY